jgi:hypothetical protein
VRRDTDGGDRRSRFADHESAVGLIALEEDVAERIAWELSPERFDVAEDRCLQLVEPSPSLHRDELGLPTRRFHRAGRHPITLPFFLSQP